MSSSELFIEILPWVDRRMGSMQSSKGSNAELELLELTGILENI